MAKPLVDARLTAVSAAPTNVYRLLDTSPAGLTAKEAATRLARIGPNRIQELPGRSLVGRLVQQFVHLFALLLWAGSVLALAAGLPTLAAAIVVVILLNGIFGFFQEYRAERAVAALKRLLPATAHVVRDEVERQIDAAELVPGDVVVLNEGDRVSADARLVDVSDVRLDESMLTGESHPVHKTASAWQMPNGRTSVAHAPNLIFAGSTVVSGTASAVVIGTGMDTEFGRIARLTQSVRAAPSPLQLEVARVARRVAVLSVIMGIGFFLIGWLFAGLTLRDGAIFGIGIVLGNVPEGLLPTMTLALAMGVQRMARRQAIVKNLSSVETLGACTVICTDKTGTLTRNEMTARELWLNEMEVTVTGSGYQRSGGFRVGSSRVTDVQLESVKTLLRVGQLCSTAHLRPTDSTDGNWQVAGDPTEVALLVAAAKAGLDRNEEFARHPLVRNLAFDSRRKRMSTVHRSAEAKQGLTVFIKGAPIELLEHCTEVLIDGEHVPLTETMTANAVAANDRMARNGERVLGMAYRLLPETAEAEIAALDPGVVERDLVFVGLVGLQDPPRDAVPAAVARCRAAGIRVIMITGDYGLTGDAIARQVGMVGEAAVRIVEGDELDVMSDDQLRDALRGSDVLFARTTPEHKLRIVTLLQSLGEVVAVTGDGVNDAPALKHADIGVAMGGSGTDVAREAADMVLQDDNFATIVAAIEEGRAIFDNMRKFIVYIFAHLSPEALPFILFALFHTPLPLTVMQILAIDLGTETLPALALGVERPEPDVMQRPPRRRQTRLLDTASLVRGYGFLGLLTSAVVMSAFFLFLTSAGWRWGEAQAPTPALGDQATTIVFLGIVLMQIGNAFACRTERASALSVGLLSNRFLLWGIAFEVVFAAVIIYAAPLQPIFGTGPLAAEWWLFLLLFVPVIFGLEEARKAVARRRVGAGAGTRG